MSDAAPRFEAVNCPKCRRSVAALVCGSVYYSHADWLVILAECPHCEEAVVAGQGVDYPDALGPATRLWPEPKRFLTSDVPAPLRTAFEEAERCFEAGAHTAAAAMTRRFLDGLVKELGGRGRNLDERIEDLKNRGDISELLFDWATELRLTGNRALHEVDNDVSRPDAEDALTFAEALAQHVFTLRRKFEEFKARRSPEPRELT